jgi:hypothetical protein
MAMAEPIDPSWDYWRGKYGHADALRDYYPSLLATDIRLQQALAQVENGMAAIEARMQELIAKEASDG